MKLEHAGHTPRSEQPPPRPGEILKRRFLGPLGMTQTELAERLGVPLQRMNQICRGRRAITPDTALRLARLLGTTAEYWLESQAAWDLWQAAHAGHTAELERIQPVPTAGLSLEDPLLAEVVRRLVQAYEPDRIYLFGSRARDEGGPDSDYDLLVVVPDDAPPERHRGRLGYRALRGTGAAVDVVVWTSGAFSRRLRVPASLPATVAREGRIVHAA
ncbi:MAG: HigA family addiction module antitoxin [Gemmatimonadota bacterium]